MGCVSVKSWGSVGCMVKVCRKNRRGDLRYAMACVSREISNVSVSLDSIVLVPCDPTGKDLVEKLTNADDFFMTSYSRPKIQYEHPNQTRDELHPCVMLERTSTRFPRPVVPRLTS